MPNAVAARWRLVDPSGIRVQRFGDEALVFNPLTWETHLLNGVAMRVLDALSTGPKPEAPLLDELCGVDESREDLGSARVEFESFLRELDGLGLIEMVEEVEGAARRT